MVKLSLFLLFLLSILLLPQSYAQNEINLSQDSSRKNIDFRSLDPNNLPHDSLYKKPKEEVFPLSYFRSTGAWTELNPKVPRVNYIGLHFVNKGTGWAISGRNILKTTDGGENWDLQLMHPSLSFTSIHFVDSLFGWASILSNRPYKTTNGGTNWIEQTNLDILGSRDIYFVNRDRLDS